MDYVENNDEFDDMLEGYVAWKPCRACGGKIVQLKETLFECQGCYNQFESEIGEML